MPVNASALWHTVDDNTRSVHKATTIENDDDDDDEVRELFALMVASGCVERYARVRRKYIASGELQRKAPAVAFMRRAILDIDVTDTTLDDDSSEDGGGGGGGGWWERSPPPVPPTSNQTATMSSSTAPPPLPPPPSHDEVRQSLEWLNGRGVWGVLAAERLRPGSTATDLDLASKSMDAQPTTSLRQQQCDDLAQQLLHSKGGSDALPTSMLWWRARQSVGAPLPPPRIDSHNAHGTLVLGQPVDATTTGNDGGDSDDDRCDDEQENLLGVVTSRLNPRDEFADVLFSDGTKVELSLERIASMAVALKESDAKAARCPISPSLGTAGAQQIANMFLVPGCAPLRELRLSRNGIGAEGAKSIASALRTGVCSSLTLLQVDDNAIGADGAAAVAALLADDTTNLTALSMARNDIGSAGALALSDALRTNNSTLKTLDLSMNRLGSDGADAIAKILQFNVTLVDLDLSFNGIGAEGTQPLAFALRTNLTLAVLNVSGNRMENAGAQHLIAALRCNVALRDLNLGNNSLDDNVKAECCLAWGDRGGHLMGVNWVRPFLSAPAATSDAPRRRERGTKKKRERQREERERRRRAK